MSLPFKSLSLALAPAGTRLLQPTHALPDKLTLASPALDAMTDLTRVAPATAEPDLSIVQAEERMKYAGVRLLFVLDDRRELQGLVTLNDIKGERPVRFQRDMGVSHGEIKVSDIMTPAERLETISLHDVLDARVGDIIQTLKRSGRQHTLVLEQTATGAAIRGIISATRLSRQLGVPVERSGIAYTFAELEAALAH